MTAVINSCDDMQLARELFRNYAAELAVDLCFQSFEAELAGLPGAYAPPKGRLLVAECDGIAGGCVALRPLEEGVCEMKRLWVSPAFRGEGLGRRLAETIIAEARKIGYRTMRLDTLARLAPALELYRSLGFQEIAPYTTNPLEGAVFLEIDVENSAIDV
jgi:ribosomal protein S18 acetylase RimI-like enzyme